MDRHGAQGIAFLLLLMSVAIVFGLTHRSDYGSESSSPLAASSVKVTSYAMGDFRQSLTEGADMRRLLQAFSPAPAPGPDTSSTSAPVLFIGYGALSADFVPCPPQTGRSYYTPNCASATGAVNPYTRGCSAITQCARDVSG